MSTKMVSAWTIESARTALTRVLQDGLAYADAIDISRALLAALDAATARAADAVLRRDSAERLLRDESALRVALQAEMAQVKIDRAEANARADRAEAERRHERDLHDVDGKALVRATFALANVTTERDASHADLNAIVEALAPGTTMAAHEILAAVGRVVSERDEALAALEALRADVEQFRGNETEATAAVLYDGDAFRGFATPSAALARIRAEARRAGLREAAEAYECDEDHDESGRTCPARWLRALADKEG